MAKNAALAHAENLEGLIDGEKDGLGKMLAPIAKYLRGIARKQEAERGFQDLVIEEIPSHGELSDELKGLTIGHLLGDAGDLLDHQNVVTSEVFGRVLFKASNGKWYELNVEGVVCPLSDGRAKEMLQEVEDEKKANEPK